MPGLPADGGVSRSVDFGRIACAVAAIHVEAEPGGMQRGRGSGTVEAQSVGRQSVSGRCCRVDVLQLQVEVRRGFQSLSVGLDAVIERLFALRLQAESLGQSVAGGVVAFEGQVEAQQGQ